MNKCDELMQHKFNIDVIYYLLLLESLGAYSRPLSSTCGGLRVPFRPPGPFGPGWRSSAPSPPLPYPQPFTSPYSFFVFLKLQGVLFSLIFEFWKFWNCIWNQNTHFWGGLFSITFHLIAAYSCFETLGGLFYFDFWVLKIFKLYFEPSILASARE